MAGFVERNKRSILVSLIGVGVVLIVGVALGLQPGPGQAQQIESQVVAAPDEELDLVEPAPETISPSAEAIRDYLRSEADGMLYGLRIAAGEDVPCGDPCARDETFEHLVGMIEYCQKLEPASFRELPNFDIQIDGEIVVALEQACGALISAQSTLGAPHKNAEWLAVVIEAKTVLEEAVKE